MDLGTITLSYFNIALLCFAVGFAGFVDSIAGGGGTISIPAYILTGLPVHTALGCNKFSGSCGTTLTVLKFWKNGAINIPVALIAAVTSFVGSYIGTSVALMIPDHTLTKVLIFVLPTAAVLMSVKRNLGYTDTSYTIRGKKRICYASIIGLLIGSYDGMFGPGTGTFAIIAFAWLMKFDLKKASGNAKILNLASNYASFITFAMAGSVIYQIAIPAAICGIIGNYAGSHVALKKGASFIRPMILIVLAMLLLKLLFDISHTL